MDIGPRADFTYDVYERLIRAAVESGYPFLTVREYLTREEHPDRFVVMRHDVDRKPGNALDMARMEADAGVSTTYYFRTKPGVFDPEIVREVEELGHEIGYHYEDLDRADGDAEGAHESFARHLRRVREVADVSTVCMHGNPLTPHDNRDMWGRGDGSGGDGSDGPVSDDYGLGRYDLDGEAYLSVDFTDVTYFSDTNRTWYDARTTVNDWPVGPSGKDRQVESTYELIDLVEDRAIDRLYLLAHPNRWAGSYPEYAAEVTKDAVIDLGKWGLWKLGRVQEQRPDPTSRVNQ